MHDVQVPNPSCFFGIYQFSKLLIVRKLSTNRKTFLHIVLQDYKEEQTIPAFKNSTLQKTVGTNLLIWFPSEITELFCRFLTFDSGIKFSCCIYLHFAALKKNWFWEFGVKVSVCKGLAELYMRFVCGFERVQVMLMKTGEAGYRHIT